MGIGFLVLVIGGICQGSFGLGYKKYSPYSWAAFWGIYDIMCIITSLIFTLIVAPNLFSIIASVGLKYFTVPLICGAVWGLSAIGFSKGIDKIGMSLVYGISMGISTIVGSLTPMILNKSIPSGKSLALLSVGLTLTLFGVIVVTIAGIKRDKKAKSSSLGIILAIFSGLGSGFMNVGFTHSESLNKTIQSFGYSQTASSAIKWLPVLIGGCIAGTIYCICEVSAKKDWNTVVAKGSSTRALKLFGVSIIWYAALILYGISTSLIGNLGNTVGWILFNALALIVSVFWGLKTGEWKNSKKGTLFLGCFILIIAWIFVALV